MKKELSKTQANEKIDSVLKRESFSSEEVRKTKRLAMSYNIKLRERRKKFCKYCLAQLRGKLRLTKTYKTIECEFCGKKNKSKLTISTS